MRVLVTGGSGFIGTALCAALRADNCEVVVLSRRPRDSVPGLAWITSLDQIAPETRLDAVVNLAGASLAERRWSSAYKREIEDSRLGTTRSLLALFRRLQQPPAVLLSASAIGYYGHHGDEVLTEEGGVTPGYAQHLCAEWEALACQAPDVRVCLLRLGVVLAAGGGALTRMAGSFRVGVASYLGSGRQWLSWVHRDDVVAAMRFLLQREDLSGPFNLTAPEPVTGREFAAGLRAHYRTWAMLPVPAPLLRLLLGEMAEELLLNGQRVVPAALQAAGFRFRYPSLAEGLDAVYEKA